MIHVGHTTMHTVQVTGVVGHQAEHIGFILSQDEKRHAESGIFQSLSQPACHNVIRLGQGFRMAVRQTLSM